MKTFKLSVFIFRRDFRLIDNIGLESACTKSEKVIPVFCFDPRQADPLQNPYFNHNSYQFMNESLKDLSQALSKQGSKLHMFKLKPDSLVSKLKQQHSIQAVFVNRDYTEFSRKRDLQIEEACKAVGVKFIQQQDYVLVPFKSIPIDTKEYKVFTPFYNRFKEFMVARPTTTIPTNFYSGLLKGNLQCPTYQQNEHLKIKGGREQALIRMSKLPKNYGTDRDFPATKDGTSKMAAYLKFGCVSIREMFFTIKKQLLDSEPLTRQLYWRQFYVHINYRNGFKCFQQKHTDLPWENDQKRFGMWKKGQTGCPIVDAAMRDLLKTGDMHNRLRMIVSSYLTKDLLVDWRWGQKHFAQYLVDYDPAQNNGGWQWAASTGCDAQPYFRIFNPSLQSQRFDSNCEYIKSQIPELQKIPNKDIHTWEQCHRKHKCYCPPIIIHSQQKEKALSLFGRQKELDEHKKRDSSMDSDAKKKGRSRVK